MHDYDIKVPRRRRGMPPLNVDNTLYYYNKYYTGKATLRRVQRLAIRGSLPSCALLVLADILWVGAAQGVVYGVVVGVHAIANENYTSIELCCYTLPPKRIKVYTGPAC